MDLILTEDWPELQIDGQNSPGTESIVRYMMWLETEGKPFIKQFNREEGYKDLTKTDKKLKWRLEQGYIPERFKDKLTKIKTEEDIKLKQEKKEETRPVEKKKSKRWNRNEY